MYPDNYAQLSNDEKIDHWCKVLYKGMRWAGEDDLDETSIFDKKLINDLRAFDSEIDQHFAEVLRRLAAMWTETPAEFFHKVNLQMGTDFNPI